MFLGRLSEILLGLTISSLCFRYLLNGSYALIRPWNGCIIKIHCCFHLGQAHYSGSGQSTAVTYVPSNDLTTKHFFVKCPFGPPCPTKVDLYGWASCPNNMILCFCNFLPYWPALIIIDATPTSDLTLGFPSLSCCRQNLGPQDQVRNVAVYPELTL